MDSKASEKKNFVYRNYWVYSIGLAVAWCIILIIAFVIHGSDHMQFYWILFLGFFIGWVSATIARYVYPPPSFWTNKRSNS